MPSAICSNLLPHYTAWKLSLNEMRQAMVAYQESGSEADRDAFRRASEEGRRAREEYMRMAYTPEGGANTCRLEDMLVRKMKASLPEGAKMYVDIHKTTSRVSMIMVRCGNVRIPETFFNELRFFSAATVLDFEEQNFEINPPPTQWSDSIETIILRRTKQKFSLTTLPKRLKELEANESGITQIPQEIPESIERLNFDSAPYFTALPDVLPQKVQKILCGNSGLISLPQSLPDTLISINIRNTPAARHPETISLLRQFEQGHPHCKIESVRI